MSSSRALARVAALLYAVTWVTSVAAVPLYGGSAFDPTAPLAGRESVLTAGLLEVLLAAAVVGTSLALYPLLRRHGPGAALGYVALRTLEASVILVGVVVILPVVAGPGRAASTGLTQEVGAGLHLVHDWTFLVGPGLVNPINATVLAVLLLRRGLVPRVIPWLGIGGSALVLGMNVAVLFGVMTVIPALAAPLFLWEILLAGHLAWRGLREGRPESASLATVGVGEVSSAVGPGRGRWRRR